jgi:hypothetical protein
MCKFSGIKTKKDRLEFIKANLASNDRWLLKGLLTIYTYQTEDEKKTADVKEHNGVGFSGFDVQIMSSFAEQAINRGVPKLIAENAPVTVAQFYTPNQAVVLRKKMLKYARQLLRIAIQKEAQKAAQQSQLVL